MAGITDWIVTLPIHNLVISDDIGGLIKLDRVTFVSTKKIPRIRKQLNLPLRISEYTHPQHIGRYFSEAKTYAFIRTCHKSSPDFLEEHVIVKKAIWILRSSQFMICKRTNDRLFGSFEYGPKLFSAKHFFRCGGQEEVRTCTSRMTPIEEYRMDRNWKKHKLKHHFFNHLIRVISRKTKATHEWRETIINAAVLAAKSHYSNELSEAFMYNIIALESLINLGNNEQKISSELYDHLYFFFGWMNKHSPRDELKKTIKRLYKLRSGFVHNGNFEEIEIADLLKLDELLCNLLWNICKHISVFSEQGKISKFSEIVKAQEILGMAPSRPRDFTYMGRSSISNNRAITDIRRVKCW